MGLPPPIPPKKPAGFSLNLAVGGLGLSTLAKTEGGKTAEEVGDMMILEENSKAKHQQEPGSSSPHTHGSS
jgi:hypothetical protein